MTDTPEPPFSSDWVDPEMYDDQDITADLPVIELFTESVEFMGEKFLVIFERDEGTDQRRFDRFGERAPACATRWLSQEYNISLNAAARIQQGALYPPPPKTPHSRDRVRPRLLREDLPAPEFPDEDC